MAKKALGYILALVGFVIFFMSFSGIRAMIGIMPEPNSFDIYMSVVGVITLMIGIYLAFKKEEVKEVPIYQGKDVVGYRVLDEQ